MANKIIDNQKEGEGKPPSPMIDFQCQMVCYVIINTVC